MTLSFYSVTTKPLNRIEWLLIRLTKNFIRRHSENLMRRRIQVTLDLFIIKFTVVHPYPRSFALMNGPKRSRSVNDKSLKIWLDYLILVEKTLFALEIALTLIFCPPYWKQNSHSSSAKYSHIRRTSSIAPTHALGSIKINLASWTWVKVNQQIFCETFSISRVWNSESNRSFFKELFGFFVCCDRKRTKKTWSNWKWLSRNDTTIKSLTIY